MAMGMRAKWWTGLNLLSPNGDNRIVNTDTLDTHFMHCTSETAIICIIYGAFRRFWFIGKEEEEAAQSLREVTPLRVEPRGVATL